ncbi:MAG: NCS2 family permease, partial [Gammaproteobacteria bacterium]
NAFVAFTLASLMSWPAAMGLVVIEGAVIVICVLTRFRTAIFRAVPAELKSAIAVGIGLFIALVGLVDGGIVHTPASLATPLELGTAGSLASWPTVVFVFGLLLTAVLLARKVKGAILIGIVAATVFAFVVQAVVPSSGWQHGMPALPATILSTPDLHLLGRFDLLGAFRQVGVLSAVVLAFSLLLSDFFDTVGTIVGVGASGGLLDAQNNPPRMGRVLFVDGLGAIAGGVASVSSNTGFIESAAGVGEGARTGFANVVTGLLLLAAMGLAPLVTMIPAEAATPALVIVGCLMTAQVRRIDFSDYGIAIPAFLTLILMPFTYSITNGIGAGFVSYAVIRLFQGRAREVHPLMWIVAALFLAYFAIEPIEHLLGLV